MERIELNLRERMIIANALTHYEHTLKEDIEDWEKLPLNTAYNKMKESLELPEYLKEDKE